MRYNPDVHHRRSLRLKGHDYGRDGTYFVTICTWGRACAFGEVTDGCMQMNDAGEEIHRIWEGLPGRLPSMALDAFVVMPNHVHGIIVLAGAGVRQNRVTLGSVVGAFKSLSARSVNRLLDRSACPLWQRNYHEHVIRGEDALNDIRRYIRENPERWAHDAENPANLTPL